VRPYEKAVAGDTIGLCLSGSGFFGFQALGSVCLALSLSNKTNDVQFGLVFTGGAGTGIPSYGITGGIMGSNASRLRQLRGGFTDFGASWGEGVTAGDDISTGRDPANKQIVENVINVGPGLRSFGPTGLPPGEIHAAFTQSVTFQFFDWHI
jgi:hypothetical protein